MLREDFIRKVFEFLFNFLSFRALSARTNIVVRVRSVPRNRPSGERQQVDLYESIQSYLRAGAGRYGFQHHQRHAVDYERDADANFGTCARLARRGFASQLYY